MDIKNLNLKDLVGTNALAKKYVKYDFQELGLMIAKRLNDEKRKSFYIKLAKYEHRGLLMQAFTYTLYNKSNNSLSKLFLWKLNKLREKNNFRSFVGIFPISWDFNISSLLASLEKEIKFFKEFKLNSLKYNIEDIKKLHITLYFFDRLPGVLFFSLSFLLESFYKLKKEYFNNPIVANKISLWNNKGKSYLVVDGFGPTIYRIYYSFIRYVKESRVKAKNSLLKVLSIKQRKFYPHITLVRIRNLNKENVVNFQNELLNKFHNTIIRINPCVTLATSNFLHNGQKIKSYYSLNYGIGGCWQKKNL